MSKTAMKNSPQEYVDELIDKYDSLYINLDKNECTQCAIIDVTNTLDALDDLQNIELIKYYYRQVLTILKNKLN